MEKCFHLVKHIIITQLFYIFAQQKKKRMRLITWHVLAFSQFILRNYVFFLKKNFGQRDSLESICYLKFKDVMMIFMVKMDRCYF